MKKTLATILLFTILLLPAISWGQDTHLYDNIVIRWGDKINNNIDGGTDYGETITYIDNDGNEQTLGSKEFDALDRDEWDYITNVDCCEHSPHHYGMWAKTPDGNLLFAIEMKAGLGIDHHQATGVKHLLTFVGSARPNYMGTVKYDGGIVGKHLDTGEHFEGSVFAHINLDEMKKLEIKIHSFYEGNFPPGFERTYEAALTTTYGRNQDLVPDNFGITQSIRREGQDNQYLHINGYFYGANMEGIAGELTDYDSDIRYSIFGATRRGN